MTRVEFLPLGWNRPLLVADCHGKHAPESEVERVANANLIAAAPEMLQALEAILESFVHIPGSEAGNKLRTEIFARCENVKTAVNKARAAIAKAKGNQ